MGKGAGCRAHSEVRGVEQSCGTAPPRGCVVWNDSCHPEGLLGPPQRSGTATTQGSASDPRHGSHELLRGHPTSQCAASWEGGCKDTRSPWKPLGVLRARRCPRGLCAALHRLQEQGPHQCTGLGLKTSNPSTRAGRTRGSISGVSAGCILWKRPGGKGRQRASSRQRGALLFWHGQEQQKPAEGTEVGPWGVSLR